ncbi:MAG: hypothetical protein VCA36_08320 [Opitutales bacterium]
MARSDPPGERDPPDREEEAELAARAPREAERTVQRGSGLADPKEQGSADQFRELDRSEQVTGSTDRWGRLHPENRLEQVPVDQRLDQFEDPLEYQSREEVVRSGWLK